MCNTGVGDNNYKTISDELESYTRERVQCMCIYSILFYKKGDV